jgi:hypothetical protein
MGFAWIVETGRRAFGVAGADGAEDLALRQRRVPSQRTGLGRHAQPRKRRPVLGGLGVTGGYPPGRPRLTAVRRPVRSRGAHASSRESTVAAVGRLPGAG